MPAYNVKHPSPTFLINKVKGWNTRLLYSYYGSTSANFDYLNETGGLTDQNLFSIISSTNLNTTSGGIYKGQWNNFPSYYFKTGKSLRVKGQFRIAGSSNNIFNIKPQIAIGGVPQSLGGPNNDNNHSLATNLVNLCPVNFETVYTSIEFDSSNPSRVYMQVNGFYQYNASDYNGNGPNIEFNPYIPIYSSSPYKDVGTITDPYELWLSFNGSDISALYVTYLTVEELQ